jgi:Sugar (pentulose and hexulose) kinases
MQLHCAAVDIGAGSGRVLSGCFDGKRMRLAEVARFPNEMRISSGRLRWDARSLRNEVRGGIEAASAGAVSRGSHLASCAIDTWGVDFALLDERDDLVEEPRTYRDESTAAFASALRDSIGCRELYGRTGIQHQHFNSLFQLYEIAQAEPELLERARSLLFMPDYLAFALCGEKANEYTIASTAQMLDARTRDWDLELCAKAGIPERILQRITRPGERLGSVLGLEDCSLVAAASHDTGSAVAGIPFDSRPSAYICSGTWCLVGVEAREPELSEAARIANFTNEGGQGGSYRFLKNRMGLWMIRGLRESFAPELGLLPFERIIAEARWAEPFARYIDCNDPLFFNPKDMRYAIDLYCDESSQPRPTSLGGYARAVYEGLAFSFRQAIDELRLFGHESEVVRLVGGGALDAMLCSCAASAIGLPVVAGPVEATAIGNLALQAISLGIVADIAEARSMIGRSFEQIEYLPDATPVWTDAYSSFLAMRARRNERKE